MNGIETTYADALTVYRLDYADPQDQRVAHAYAVRVHPVLLLIDAEGSVVRRWDGVVSQEEITIAINVLRTP
ncbi:MAG: hypothetical protein FJ040_10905 [Chloroflexi bacterium]|nr:hypothetical protein [Chloroflexota bacterium]